MKKYFCSSCNNLTNHEVLSNHEVVYHGDGDETFGWSVKWEIIQCKGCDMLSGREVRTYEDDWDERTGDHLEYETLYPKRGKDILQIRNFLNLPSEIRSIYRETIDCFNSDSNLLCAAGLRALLEGICKAHSITDGPVEENKGGTVHMVRKSDLRGKIAGLHEKGLLTKGHADNLHDHRFFGNEALHDLKKPTTDQLKIAIEIIEHTLENLYELPYKSKKLSESRKP